MKKNTVRLQNVTLGEGMPKICVPVMGQNLRELEAAVSSAREQADLIELRLDSFSPDIDADKLCEVCRAVRFQTQGTALLATMRTVRDGGAGDADAARYEALLAALTKAHLCDALDAELSVGEAAFARIVKAAHAADVPIVGSFHDFEKTPSVEAMEDRLKRMAALGADVCKIAVMPKTDADVRALQTACARTDETLTQPIIAISMGALGVSTRTEAETFGSCLSFGTVGAASAPGQMEAHALRQALEAVHKKLTSGANQKTKT